MRSGFAQVSGSKRLGLEKETGVQWKIKPGCMFFPMPLAVEQAPGVPTVCTMLRPRCQLATALGRVSVAGFIHRAVLHTFLPTTFNL